MGLFNSYVKEGKGVNKDEARPIRPLYFLEVLGRKFWKLIQMNLLYIVLTIPVWIGLYFFVSAMLSQEIMAELSIELLGQFLCTFALIFIVFSPLIGPATAGITYVFKSFATETPVFVFADFFEQFKKNFKQSTLMTAINGVVMMSFSYTLMYGNTAQLVIGGQATLGILRLPLFIFFILLIFMNYYAFSMMVMFKMKFFDIIKNSFIFALAKLPLNLLILVLVCGACYLAFMYPIIGILLTVLILYAFCGFLVTFSVYGTIEKYMLIPAQEQEEDVEETEEVEVVFEDNRLFETSGRE